MGTEPEEIVYADVRAYGNVSGYDANTALDAIRSILLAARWVDTGTSCPSRDQFFGFDPPVTTVPDPPVPKPLYDCDDPYVILTDAANGDVVPFCLIDAYRRTPGLCSDGLGNYGYWVELGLTPTETMENLVGAINAVPAPVGTWFDASYYYAAGHYHLVLVHRPGTDGRCQAIWNNSYCAVDAALIGSGNYFVGGGYYLQCADFRIWVYEIADITAHNIYDHGVYITIYSGSLAHDIGPFDMTDEVEDFLLIANPHQMIMFKDSRTDSGTYIQSLFLAAPKIDSRLTGITSCILAASSLTGRIRDHLEWVGPWMSLNGAAWEHLAHVGSFLTRYDGDDEPLLTSDGRPIWQSQWVFVQRTADVPLIVGKLYDAVLATGLADFGTAHAFDGHMLKLVSRQVAGANNFTVATLWVATADVDPPTDGWGYGMNCLVAPPETQKLTSRAYGFCG